MADPPRYPDTGEDHDVGSAHGSGGRSVRSKLVLLGVIVLVVAFVVLHLTGVVGPEH
jgi:hypothetical protein